MQSVIFYCTRFLNPRPDHRADCEVRHEVQVEDSSVVGGVVVGCGLLLFAVAHTSAHDARPAGHTNRAWPAEVNMM